jgi:hypothetical protein
MRSLEQCVDKSTRQYQDLLDYVQQLLDDIVHLKPEEVINCCKKLQDMQDDTCKIDGELQRIMTEDNRSQIEKSAAFNKRLKLMRKVQDLNKKLRSKIISMQTVVASELCKAREGLVAMSGYKTEVNQPGLLLNKSC